MEIWYADVYDPVNNSVFVVQFTYGPDPLKKETVLFVSFHAYMPDQGVTSLTRQISPEQLNINKEPYRVTFGKNVIRTHKNTESRKTEYHIQINLEHILMDIYIEPVVNSWLPFGERVTFYDRERKGIFSWIPSIPEGKVNGSVAIGQNTAKLTDAHGYYDHTYWETGTHQPFHPNPLFWDDVLVSWSWLKIIHDDIKIAINEFRFRPWLNNCTISTFMVCKDDSIMLSCNHEAQMKKIQSSPDQPYIKAGEFSLSCSLNDMNLKLELTPTILLRYQDMLEYINPLSRPLVRMIFGNPVAFYTLALVNVDMNFGTENIAITNAMALYEPMVLTTRPSRFEDRIRKLISHKISRRI
ncbi:MAG: hypothetical protein R6U78_08530 [Bacteroidales bacterium]